VENFKKQVKTACFMWITLWKSEKLPVNYVENKIFRFSSILLYYTKKITPLQQELLKNFEKFLV